MKSKRIYIAGKISDIDLEVAKLKFHSYSQKILNNNTIVINPFVTNSKLIKKGNGTWEQYMKNDIRELIKCDEAHFLPCWKESKGAKIEHQLCLDLGIKIIYA